LVGIQNPKFFKNSIVYYLFFICLVFLTFFSISNIYTRQQILEISIVFHYMD